MRRLVFALVALSLVASCKLRKLASVVSFEGEVDMAMSMPMAGSSGATTTTFEMKGSKMRTSSTLLSGFATITDMDAKKSWTINPSSRTYTELDLAAASKTPSAAAAKSKAKAVKTGRSDKVAGYSCDVYEIVDPSAAPPTPIELCMASGLSMMALGLTGPFASFAQTDDAWTEVLSHGFPLRISVRDPSGKPMMTMEATRIERKSIPDSEFQVPAGYTKTASPI